MLAKSIALSDDSKATAAARFYKSRDDATDFLCRSQRRYIGYYGEILRGKLGTAEPTLVQLRQVHSFTRSGVHILRTRLPIKQTSEPVL
eukprot:SAG11_NODE_2141_length_3756_cov_1.771124_3_plen_89_part_00